MENLIKILKDREAYFDGELIDECHRHGAGSKKYYELLAIWNEVMTIMEEAGIKPYDFEEKLKFGFIRY